MNFTLAFINLFFTNAIAQDLDVHGFHQAPSDGDVLEHTSVWQAEPFIERTLTIEPLLEYAEKPLTLHKVSDGVESTEILVDDLVVLNVGAFYSPTKRLALTLTAPFYLSTKVKGESEGLGLGNARLATPISLLSKNEDSFNLSAVPYLDIPGFYKETLTSKSTSGGLLMTGSLTKDRVDISVNFGTELKPRLDYYNLEGREKLITNLGASYLITDFTAAGVEVLAEPSLNKNSFPGTESPIEAMATLRGKRDSLGWTIGFSKALNRGVSAATWRVIAGLDFTFKKHEEVPLECKYYLEKEPEEIVKYIEPEPLVKVEGDQIILMKPIYFDFDSADIRFPDSQQVMSDLVKVLEDHPEITLLRVATGTDPRGSEEYNYSLSLRRAESVISFLVEHGLSKDRFISFGYGESKLPMGDCSTEECYEKDRFAEFSILEIQE